MDLCFIASFPAMPVPLGCVGTPGRHHALLDMQFLRHVIQVDRQDLAHALFLHGGVGEKSAPSVPAFWREIRPLPSASFSAAPIPLGCVGTPGRHHALLDMQFLRHVIQVDRQDLAHALFLHGGVGEKSAPSVPAFWRELRPLPSASFSRRTRSTGLRRDPWASPCLTGYAVPLPCHSGRSSRSCSRPVPAW